MNEQTPGMVVKHRFVIRDDSDEGTKKRKGRPFKSYLSYTDRQAAADKFQYSGMVGYMGNEEKTSHLFGKDSDSLGKEEKEYVKKAFDEADKKGLPMWQTVISFDNEWLSENGLYDKESGRVRSDKLMDYSRSFMTKIEEKEGIETIWAGAVHYNTDNLHIHFAYVDSGFQRDRGKFKYGSIKAAKSTFVSKMIRDQKENTMITQLMREGILEKQKQQLFLQDLTLADKMLRLYEKMPEDRRTWHYGYNVIKPLHPYIDEITSEFLEIHAKEEYESLNKLLDIQEFCYSRAYGNDGGGYKENKLKDLRIRMGNTVLHQLRDYDKMVRKEEFRKRNSSRDDRSVKVKMSKNGRKIDAGVMIALHNMKRLLRKDIKSIRNQEQYREMVAEEERQIRSNEQTQELDP